MKIDLHVHSSERSSCATVTAENQVRAAIAAGLDGIAFTDHDMLVPREQLAALNEQFAPFKIFTGIEVSANDLHWVVLGIYDTSLESKDWQYPNLHRFVREQGGFMILAHPFRYKPEIMVDLDQYPPDGIEIESINTPAHRREDIRAIANRLGIVEMRNSDGHRPGGVASYHNVLPRPVYDDQELIQVLHEMKQQ